MDIGSVVYSKAGRDKGRYYLAVGISDKPEFVLIADGEIRKLEKPKLKKIKHLRDSGIVIDKLKDKFVEKKPVHNAEIRSCLRVYNEKTAKDTDSSQA
ncbi:MAG: KOW domain-containing RNA-binding protein [Clostridiales bacterium]|jgi:ribosomal protein L14E/L6E/L27E|nr:KOW domain-containing RNA-binding protein [Clostridiales bacterium]